MYYNTITADMYTSEIKENIVRKGTKRRKRKHIPHAQRSSEYVEKRNKRERNRIRAVNEAFEGLRKRVPSCAQDPDLRISKMEILTHAIGYIEGLCGSLGYRDFAEYCRWEGRRTLPGRGKENPGQEQQERESSITNNSPQAALLPVCKGGLRERQTNMAVPASHTTSPHPQHPWESANAGTPSTHNWFPTRIESHDIQPITGPFDFLSDQSFDAVDNTVLGDFSECKDFQTGCELSENSVCHGTSYVPLNSEMTSARVGSLMTFSHVTKFYHSNTSYL